MSTINDVSRLANVSKATVSRVLSGSRGVKEESRLAVMKAVETLNYKPNVIAQFLTAQSTGCVGVICATEHIQQTTSYLFALEKQFSQHQKHLLLRFADNSIGVANAIAELANGLCDAIIIIGARFALPSHDENIIMIDCLESSTPNSILFDHSFAAETACHYLVSQGRRHIALLNHASGTVAEQTLLGYQRALENYLIPYNRSLVMGNVHSSSEALQTLLNNGAQFNALLVMDEIEAQKAISLLHVFKRTVPDKVMVFSLDGSVQLPGIPAVPAIEYSLETLARKVVDLIDARAGKHVNPQVFRGNLVVPHGLIE
ncbi:LacI family DNA-binding transcriptional regulator [Yersinia sp. 1652 StPb PI]|uniref:LacI family DNA-binding transcriptional regulator n=1 Tax=unclassified Yersinia (in: enterobacteria) TaxID=2653513 RepID=UPI00355B2D9B